VAGTIGAAGYGVAPAARLVPVRVMDCAGAGTLSGLLAGIDWMIGDHPPGVPAVANLSLGTGASSLLDAATERAVADGIVVAVAAGNDGADACQSSPARAPSALTVGATGQGDARASFSNWGSCLDLFAPGAEIPSTWIGGGIALASGTSMASPHVAGAAARLLTGTKGRPVADVVAAVLAEATANAVADPGAGSPNRLLHLAGGGASAVEAPAAGGGSADGAAGAPSIARPAAPRVLAARHRGDWIAIRIRGPKGARYEVFRDGRLLLTPRRTRVLVRHGADRTDRLRVRAVTDTGVSRWSNAVIRTGPAVRVARR
jgi:subtilisin family serine protease